MVRLSDTIVKRILELREKGLGYRRIASSIFREFGVRVSYKTVERVLRYFSGVKVTSDSEDTCHFRTHIISSDKPEDGLGEDVDGARYRRLGPTQKLVLAVMSRSPDVPLAPAHIRYEIFRLYRKKVSRRAVWAALKRLEKRGLVFRVPDYYLVSGERITGAYRLRIPRSDGGVSVHNMRVFNVTVVREFDGFGVPLSYALFEASRLGLTYPVSEVELGYDLFDPYLYKNLKEKGVSLFKIYLKPRPGHIRIEALLSKPNLRAEVRFLDAWVGLYKSIIGDIKTIVDGEASRIGLVSRGEQLVVGVGSRLAA